MRGFWQGGFDKKKGYKMEKLFGELIGKYEFRQNCSWR
jgi:hypothetical protein